MTCAWKELLSILPSRFRQEVDDLGRESLQELRLRRFEPPEMVLSTGSHWLTECVREEDLEYVVNAASRYSPWMAQSSALGYITAPGGHRIGICGEAICKNNAMEGIRQIQSLCIRVARDFPGIAKMLATNSKSILILGPPGSGKTTLLRDLIRQLSEREIVCVVDERMEVFPQGFRRGKRIDILSGCPKYIGIEQLLRTMGPHWIAVDEITANRDCIALEEAVNCGVRLLATAHAGSVADFKHRSTYARLAACRAFETAVVLNKNKSYHVEGICA